MNKKVLIGLVVAVVTIVLVCVLGGQLASRLAPASTPTPGSVTAVEERPVTAKGVIVPVRYARLSLPTGGTLARLAVKEGDRVKAGQLLAELDVTELELAVQAAKVGLTIAEAQLALSKVGASSEDVAVAQANYQSALAQYERVKAGPTQEEINIAKADLQRAEAALKQAQANYDQVAWMPGIGAMPQSLALEQATIDYDTALNTYRLKTAGPTQADLKIAQANVASAKAALDKARKGPLAEDIAVAEARLDQAKVELERARLALERAKLTAPFAGTVVSIAAREGEMVTPGAPLITLADLSELRVETTDLDEWGAARVKSGGAVRITVNAFEEKVLTGRVAAIALESITLPTGDVAYTATITLDHQDPQLRWGMTVKVVFSP